MSVPLLLVTSPTTNKKVVRSALPHCSQIKEEADNARIIHQPDVVKQLTVDLWSLPGAVPCGQCKGTGINQEDKFDGRFKAGQTCWLCRSVPYPHLAGRILVVGVFQLRFVSLAIL